MLGELAGLSVDAPVKVESFSDIFTPLVIPSSDEKDLEVEEMKPSCMKRADAMEEKRQAIRQGKVPATDRGFPRVGPTKALTIVDFGALWPVSRSSESCCRIRPASSQEEPSHYGRNYAVVQKTVGPRRHTSVSLLSGFHSIGLIC